ncbi:hypothetical protein L1049_006504 [Liquidambar formosana]|uniref:Uncharacterized protein n=1 Tax=Liquidambar formosana TaxID=63359 RepID=A0AAP0RHB7_LIQFO
MDLQNMQNQDMSLVLSTDAKPRLKWTPELHHRFIEAITQLGGADKATPKTLMRVMGIPGLTLYHLKSHLQAFLFTISLSFFVAHTTYHDIIIRYWCSLLQKYRLGKNQESETCSDNNQEDYRENQNRDVHFNREICDGTHNQINESLQIAQALQMQMEVQRKLHEQIEVQRHLQLRIEAQGKYLQSVLKKAQETLAGYNSSPVGVELAKAELSQLVSMVNTSCPSSSFSELTETRGSNLKDVERKPMRGTGSSMESSLTSSESSGRKEEKQPKKNEGEDTYNECNITSIVLPLMKTHQEDGQPWKSGPSNQASGRKRSGSTISDGNCAEQPPAKKSPAQKEKTGDQLRMLGSSEMLDLNSQYQIDIDSCPKAIDLNCQE